MKKELERVEKQAVEKDKVGTVLCFFTIIVALSWGVAIVGRVITREWEVGKNNFFTLKYILINYHTNKREYFYTFIFLVWIWLFLNMDLIF